MARRGRRKSEETRAAILRCAAEVFAGREYHEVRTDEIAAKLGVGKGTLYRYFRSKEELYFATVVEGLEDMHRAVIRVLETEAPLRSVIEGLVRTVLQYFWNRRDFFVLLYRMEPRLDPEKRTRWQKRREEVLRRVTALLRRELPRRSVALAHPRMAVEILLGMTRSACLYRGASDSLSELARLVASIFLEGVAGRAAAAVARSGAAATRPAAVRRHGRAR